MLKYRAENLIPMLRLAAEMRNQMVEANFTDNGGAIHSAERILNILGVRLKYPGLSHINNLRFFEGARFSEAAMAAHRRGERVQIEHVAPLRALTRLVIQEIDDGATDAELELFVRSHFELALLTPEERRRLDGINRSKMGPDRLEKAGINLITLTAKG